MITAEKPTLDETLLAHHGVKGMHWGQRRSSGSSSTAKSAVKPSAADIIAKRRATRKKVAIGVGVTAGAAAIAYVLVKHRNTKIKNLKSLERSSGNIRRMNQHFQKFANDSIARDPLPTRMMAEARRAADRERMYKASNQHLVEKTWRDAANLKRTPGASTQATDALRNARMRATQDHATFRKKAADVSRDIANANAEQDAWMRRQGLGSYLNRKP